MIDETMRELRTSVRRLERRYERLAEQIQELRKELHSTKPQEPVQKPDDSNTFPQRVNDKASLSAFAQALLAERYHAWMSAEELESIAKEIRNALVDQYTDIALHPRWQNTDHRHLDAIFWISGNAIVDIVRASDEAGRISDKLQWLVYPEGGAS